MSHLPKAQSQAVLPGEGGEHLFRVLRDRAIAENREALRLKPDFPDAHYNLGAEPSPNSVAAMNLLRLSQFTDRSDWKKKAEKTLRAFSNRLEKGDIIDD